MMFEPARTNGSARSSAGMLLPSARHQLGHEGFALMGVKNRPTWDARRAVPPFRMARWRCLECGCDYQAATRKRKRLGLPVLTTSAKTCSPPCARAREHRRRAYLKTRWKLYSEQHQAAEPYPDQRRRRGQEPVNERQVLGVWSFPRGSDVAAMVDRRPRPAGRAEARTYCRSYTWVIETFFPCLFVEVNVWVRTFPSRL